MLVEIIGLAGAGKSSLLRALKQNPEVVTHADRLSVRKIGALPFYLGTSLQTAPFFLSLYQQGCRLSREEMSRVLYVAGMHRYFRRHNQVGKPLILDQGPVFELATLYGFGPPQLHEARFQAWWQQQFQVWAQSLDLVVWLSAAPEVLLERIRSREQRHAVKASSSDVAKEFLQRYQSAYEVVLKALATKGKPKIVQLDSSSLSVEALTAQVGLIICGKYDK